jgi:hypothetical protein
MPESPPLTRRLLIAHAPPQAFAPMARAILARLGYRIVSADEVDLLPDSPSERRPDLCIVDESLLDRIPPLEPGSEPPVPVVLLTGRGGTASRDPRIVGAVRKPAGMHDLYRLIQQILEETPRATPRAPVQLAGRCTGETREWKCRVLSLSENGCLVRSGEPIPLGSLVQLAIELPDAGVVETEAEAAYQLISEVGLVFHATPPAARRAIVEFVTRQLAKI